jgi:uncharacterized protein (TIGR03437 family)
VTPSAPTAAANGVINAATATAGPAAPNSWVTIFGTNLAATTRAWAAEDFVNGGMPFSLDGVSVLVNQFGAPRLAYVGYVSPTQVNFLLPSDFTPSAATVQVRNPAGMTTAVACTVAANAGQLFMGEGKAVLGAHANGTLLGKGAPAAPGETIVIYGTGLGATSPALIAGVVPAESASLATAPRVTIGGTAATVTSATVVAGSAGVYQIVVQVPTDAPNGDLPVVVILGTTNTEAAVLTVQK